MTETLYAPGISTSGPVSGALPISLPLSDTVAPSGVIASVTMPTFAVAASSLAGSCFAMSARTPLVAAATSL